MPFRRPAIALVVAAVLGLVPPAAAAPAERTPDRARVERADDYRELFDEQELTGSGAWCWFADPRAVHVAGRFRRTYTGWIDSAGNIKLAAFDHDTHVRSTAVLRAGFPVDDHNNPAILALPDGRLLVFFSGHGGRDMFVRRSVRPEDVTAWEPATVVGTNLEGRHGYTYPNPVRLAAEGGRIYLFWRGGNFNPAFSTSDDDGRTWAPARHLIDAPGHRPYVKVASNGTDTITFAFTDAHPDGFVTSMYSMSYRDGGFYKADGTRIAGLADLPLRPEQADKIFDGPANGTTSWVHDTALDAQGRPVITYATIPAIDDHRYRYARWLGDRWLDVELTKAGPAIIEDPKQQLYSGGITLDHEDPSVVYLSRRVGAVHEIERWSTTDEGTSWTAQPVTSGSAESNFRPVSPRGLPPGEDLEVIWMTGRYPTFTTFQTVLNRSGVPSGGEPPVAAFTSEVGAVRLGVTVDGTRSRDPDGSVAAYAWDFGDGATAAGPKVTHPYAAPGTYPVTLTVTDDTGHDDVFASEVTVDEQVPTKLRISATPNPVEAGTPFQIGGRLVRADTGAYVPGQVLTVLRRRAGNTRWGRAAELRTPANGLVTFTDSQPRNTEYLIRHTGNAAWGPSESPVKLVVVTHTVVRGIAF
jgi:PKD repeat protein